MRSLHFAVIVAAPAVAAAGPGPDAGPDAGSDLPEIRLTLGGQRFLVSGPLPDDITPNAEYSNLGAGPASDAVMRLRVPTGVTIAQALGGTVDGDTATWLIGEIGISPGEIGDPFPFGSRAATLDVFVPGEHTLTIEMDYRAPDGTIRSATPVMDTIRVVIGDGEDGNQPRDGGDADAGVSGSGSGDGCNAGGGASIGAAFVVLIALRRRRQGQARAPR